MSSHVVVYSGVEMMTANVTGVRQDTAAGRRLLRQGEDTLRPLWIYSTAMQHVHLNLAGRVMCTSAVVK